METGLLIGMCERFGLSSIARVELLERIHHNQSLEAFGKMSFVILQTVAHKPEQRKLPSVNALRWLSWRIIGTGCDRLRARAKIISHFTSGSMVLSTCMILA
ncbi:MAG TPA: hypothetical protein VLL97_03225 [Acidobacteriota bacterium]|nr:hypothetical protein [Acidobacteriota bacterium]